MKLSTKARYGLRACFVLALNGDKVMPIGELAQKSSVTPKYLEKLMRILKKDGLVTAERGTYGGYFLAKDPKDITVGEIFRSLEDNLELTDCLGEGCSDEYCPNRNILKKLYISINSTLDSFTLKDLVDDYKCM